YRSGLAGIVPLAEARITLERIEDGALVVDSVVPIQPGDTAVDLSASVVMVSAAQEFTLNIYLITPAGDTAYRGGPVTVTPSSDAVDPTPVPVDLVYVGVGSEAAGVRILSEGEHLFSGDSVLLLAEAFDSGGSPIPGTPIGWASLDPLTASIPDDTEGWVVGGQRGTARITATLPTGSSDTTSVAVQPVPSQVVVVSGSGQSAEVGTTLPNPIVLEVQGADGLPVTGVSVRLVAAAGSTSPDSLGVDGSGRLSFTWTLGVTAGTQSVTATVVEYPAVQATVTATADAKPATDLAIVSGNDQTGPVATALSDSLVVLATDIDGQPVANTTITWFVTLNDGTVSPTTSVTDANGLAATEWTLGSLAGANEVFAGLPGITPPSSPDSVGLAPQAEGVTFAATGEPGPAAVLELVSGDAQSDTVGATLPLPIVVRVTDLFGNPVQDVTVDFTTADGGTLVPASTTTDVDGLAQSVWTLGLEAGTQSATATSTGLAGSPVTFSATATSTIAPPGINVWTATSGTWSTDANWSLGRAPVEGDTVEITQGGDYVVALDQNATIAKLTLGGTGSSIALQVSGNTLTITDTGVEPGLLIFPSGNLEIATATVTAERVRNEGQIEGTGSGANLLASAITNIGLMQVLSGDFTVTHGASYDLQSSGGLRVESGASFTIGPNGALTYLAGQLSGLGTLHFESGTEMSLNADLAYDSLTIQMVDGFIQPIATERLTVGPDATLILSQQSGVMTSNAIVVNQGTMTVAEGPVAQNDSLYVATGGLLQIQPYSSSSLTVQRGLDNAGTIELGSATPVVSSLSLTVAQGSLTNRASGTIITLPYDQARYLAAQLVNDGTITLQGSLYFSTPEAQHVNRGLINVVGGTLEIGLNGTNPTFANEGTFHLSGGDVTVSMNNDNARLVSSGTLLIDAGRAMRCFDDLTSGTMDVTAGSLGLDGTLLAPDTLFVQAGAVVQGSGVIDGSAVVGGDLSGDVLPGNVDQAGTLTFVGDLPQTATSTFYMELGGTGAGESDLIEITGTATIGGTIDASTILPTYTPAAGDTIPIIIAGEGSGEPVLVLPADPPGLTVSVYSVDATAPTPDTAYVVFTGVALPGVSWTGAGDGSSWSDPDNWNKGGSPAVPGVGDSVFIALDGATVTLNAVAQVAALEVTGTVAELTHTGGTLTIDSSMTIGPNATYALVGGTLAGTGGVDVQGTMAWASGSLQISGTTAIASGAVLTMSGATKSLYNGTISNAGWLVWNGGTLY
ncbi:MAG: hypothetical protein PVH40_08075, partial [Gemmatimonadales bacterium]